MKTLYLVKSFLPFAFLPVAPRVIQAELEREGILAPAGGEVLSLSLQILFTLAIFVWIAYTLGRRGRTQAFLKMSSLSKKVFHGEEWISVERYLAEHHNIQVSHALTPEECEEWIRESEAYLGIEIPELPQSPSKRAAEPVAAK